ncbi:E3 ubiquitin-protein ligase PUB22-like isoform X1 [Solanum stenotomum]|uniref:E3 ubiquitin-protein ligase PUB22-like isoform X1 n=1 Tax=Solanum stenotomum TaxID=172797 RepID=UPI0020D12266|nr:E3 ubiquitin-protein ligase PUB22-like isoform X1 [Solanum stenotomum]XP_049413413.1 E3 ubiquitin-protein ligase PUB22-like isoform X1 [Solanum stenotomum]
MEEIQIPPYFICPISLEMMKDPVTISTGITYDRENIEKWIFSAKNNTCPVTKQSLTTGIELTPNVTLRRFIQSWCTINASHGIERFPTPKPPVSKPQIIKLLKEAKSPKMQMKSLKTLRSIASENDANKRCMESAGAMEFLASIINNNNSNEVFEEEEEGFMSTKDEALSILYQLKLSEQGLKSLIMSGNGEFIESLTCVMQHGSYESRAYAVMLMKDMFEVSTPTLLLSLKQEFFTQVVQVLRDEISQKATKASLQVLVHACPFGRNRVKAAEAGTIRVLVDLLLDSSEKRVCELMLILLDQLCQSAEGRAELLNHPGGLAIVSKKILRVSKVGSERAIKILHSISKFSSTPSVVQEMLSLGVVAKLCLVLQVDCGSKSKERAREILKFHAKAWSNSPCIPNNLLSSYPF